MGVRRAMDNAYKSVEKYPNHAIYTLGPLIHNKNAIQQLQEQGIGIINTNVINTTNIKENPAVVILSAHGTPYSLKQELENASIVVVDATCPRVLSNQKKIYEHAKKGYTVFIVGDKTHAEVCALEASVPKDTKCYVLQNALEAKNFVANDFYKEAKTIVVSQTTITREEYDTVISVLQGAIEDIVVFDTICPATLERQQALKDLFESVDGIIIVGGKNSANTERLYQIAKERSEDENNTKFVCHIETASEIPKEFFLLKKVGISAGASTPDDVILEVEKALQKGAS